MPESNASKSEHPAVVDTQSQLDALIGDVKDLVILGHLVGYNLRGIEPTAARFEEELTTHCPHFESAIPKAPSKLTWAERSVSEAVNALPKSQRLRLEVADKTSLYTMYSLHEYDRENDAHSRVGRLLVSIINGRACINMDPTSNETTSTGDEVSFLERVRFVFSHAKELIDRRTAEDTFATQTVGTFIKNELIALGSIPVQRGQRFVRMGGGPGLIALRSAIAALGGRINLIPIVDTKAMREWVAESAEEDIATKLRKLKEEVEEWVDAPRDSTLQKRITRAEELMNQSKMWATVLGVEQKNMVNATQRVMDELGKVLKNEQPIDVVQRNLASAPF